MQLQCLPQRLKSIFFEKYFQVEKGTLHSEKNSEIIDLITHLQVNRVHACPSRQNLNTVSCEGGEAFKHSHFLSILIELAGNSK